MRIEYFSLFFPFLFSLYTRTLKPIPPTTPFFKLNITNLPSSSKSALALFSTSLSVYMRVISFVFFYFDLTNTQNFSTYLHAHLHAPVQQLGLHRTALREIKFLPELKHENIIKLQDVYIEDRNISLVLEFCQTDVERIIKDETLNISAADIKSIMLMAFQGLEYLHANWILHRDLKPNNLLVTADGVVKIADLGLSTFYGSPSRDFTSLVVTIWYRAPELLFGATCYGAGIDVWAMGCIQAELELRRPLLPGESEIDQLDKIFSLLGSCSPEEWPGASELPNFMKFEGKEPVPWENVLMAASKPAIDIISKMLVCNPMKRLTSKEILLHEYFTSKPAPTPPGRLPLPRPAKQSELPPPAKPTKRKAEDPDVMPLSKKLTFD
eukprot:m.114326 g.114326  ORF g.114326 m.114326 type:complete len:382 (-) comp22926_c0_seq2:152-1297(-)